MTRWLKREKLKNFSYSLFWPPQTTINYLTHIRYILYPSDRQKVAKNFLILSLFFSIETKLYFIKAAEKLTHTNFY